MNFVNSTDKQIKLILQLRNNNDIRKWMFTQTAISENEHRRFINKLKNDFKNIYFSVFTTNEELLGVIYLQNIDLESESAYLGIYSNIECNISNKGDVLMSIIKFIAYTSLKLNTLKLEVFSNNERAIKFYKKQNFIQQNTLTKTALINNQLNNIEVFVLTNINLHGK